MVKGVIIYNQIKTIAPTKEGKDMMETKIVARARCIKCGAVIGVVEQIDTGKEYRYNKVNLAIRYIDRWGYERNFCKKCMR